MKTTFTKKIAKNNKKIVAKVAKVAKKNPTAAVAITATAGTGFLGLGTLNVVQYMRNRKLIKAAKAMDEMDEAQASSTNANNAQTPVQKPQAEPTAPTTNETTTASKTTTPGEQVFPALLQAAFNEFLCVRKDPRAQGWTDEQLADATARRFATDPLSISAIYYYIIDSVAKINFDNLQAAVMKSNNTQTHEPEVFNKPEGTTANDETDNTNPDEGKYPASSKKQQQNGKKGNNNKKN